MVAVHGTTVTLLGVLLELSTLYGVQHAGVLESVLYHT